MEVEKFISRMKEILEKAGNDSEMCLDWLLVSGDPDVVADFGVDYEGNLVIDEKSFPISIESITQIRYRWNSETDYSDCFYRFEFGENHLDACFGDCGLTGDYHVRFNNKEKTCMKYEEAVKFLSEKNTEIE